MHTCICFYLFIIVAEKLTLIAAKNAQQRIFLLFQQLFCLEDFSPIRAGAPLASTRAPSLPHSFATLSFSLTNRFAVTKLLGHPHRPHRSRKLYRDPGSVFFSTRKKRVQHCKIQIITCKYFIIIANWRK